MNQTTINHANLKYDVLVEKNCEKGYTARVLAWPDLVVQAATREEVLCQVRTLLLERLAKAEIITLEIKPEEITHSWLPFAGMWADDPDMEEFRAEIARYRRELDSIHSPWMLEPESENVQLEPEVVVA